MSDGFSLPKPVAADMLREAFHGKQKVETLIGKHAVDGKSLKEQAVLAQ